MAHLSKCKGLLEAFAKGWHPHLSVACKKYGVNYDDIYPIYKDEQHPDYTTWKIRRKQAKHIVFGCIYHIGAAKLAEELSDPKTGLVVTPKESQRFLDDFFKDLQKWMEASNMMMQKLGLGSSQYWKWCIETLGVLENRYPHPLVVKFLVDILSYQDEAVSQIQGRKQNENRIS